MPAEKAAALPGRLEPIALLSQARTYEVWDAWDPGRACRVAVKRVRPDRRGDERAGPRLVAEGELLERLRHPHVVRALETLTGPEPALVMECLGGATLAHLVDDGEPLDANELAHLGLQLVSAVAYLHREGFLHLDLKPSNVIVEGGRSRLIDLGLAARPGPIPPGAGTWSYLAPEQVSGDAVGPAADVWGLGATLFDCACGFPPFDDPALEGSGEDEESATGEGGAAVTGPSSEWPGEHPQLSRSARPLAQPRPDLDPRLGDLVAACLRTPPERRPELAELAATLEIVAGLPQEERRVSRAVAG